MRSLNNLGVEANNFGPMLVPVLLSKLPSDFKLIISRQFGKNVWNIEQIIKSFKVELEARERIKLATVQPRSQGFFSLDD